MLFLLLVASAPSFAAVHTERFKIGGDWCFVKRNGGATDRAIIILHGNGELVGAEGSSWETRKDENRLMETLAEAGFLVAQSNAGAVPGNGMWGNSLTQQAVLALMDHLRLVDHIRRFDAIAISAGNLTLLNLLLRGASFEHVVLLAPVTSLASLYRCPAGVDRVQQISEAYGFTPGGGCPGDPGRDEAFRRATDGYDPSALSAFTAAQQRLLRATRWMTVYEEKDPKVPSQENILSWKKMLKRHGIDLITRVVTGAGTHTGPDLLPECMAGLSAFLGTTPDCKSRRLR